jgi:signal transduction histidine kinase
MTIRTRLTLWYTGMLTLIILIFSVAVISMNQISIMAILDQTLKEVATSVGTTMRLVPVAEFGEAQPQVLPAHNDVFNKPSVWVQVWQTHDEGVPIEPRLVRASEGMRPEDGMLANDARSTTEAFVEETTFNGTLTRVASEPFYINGALYGVVQVGTSTAGIASAGQALMLSVGIAAVACILVSVGLGTWIASRLLKPIAAMTATADSIVNADDLKKRLPVEEPMDEIGRLASVFNQTLSRLENLFQVQQRFVGDVSHELRTPLTSILGNLEIMQRYGYDEESLNAVYREAERMSRMVNDLLLLARADNGELKIDLAPIDLDPILVEVYEQSLILAKKRSLKIRMGDIDEVRINGNADRMKQLLLNLVNNAIKFTPDGGTITLSLVKMGTRAVVEIEDTGIGISPEDQKRIFDRFFQADNSRVHRSESDGAGLGLSIARWIAEAHKGSIEVESEIGRGTTFRIVLPTLDSLRTTKIVTKEWLKVTS